MGLDKILAISGKPGLYELTAQTRGGFIAKSMLDGKKIAVNMRHNVSILSEIAIYTYTEEVPLGEVFKKIKEKENGEKALSHKASKQEMENYFSEVLPDYDEDRVYASDMKKMLQWYNLLTENGFSDFSKAEKTTETKPGEDQEDKKTKDEEE